MTTISLADVIARPPSGRARAVLIDGHDYAQSVFLQGRPVPWQDPMAYSNFLGQAQGVFKSDLALLNLDRFYAHQLESNSELRVALSAKNRTGFALRTLLADAGTTARVLEFATIFVKTQRAPVVLQIPSPMQWLARTQRYSATPGELDADDAENSSMYVADWLRSFAALPLAGVLLDDRPLGAGDENPVVPLETYSPIIGVTEHYGWTLGLRRGASVEFTGTGASGVVTLPGFWLDDQDPPPGDFLVGEIPATAVPEVVVTRIAALG